MSSVSTILGNVTQQEENTNIDTALEALRETASERWGDEMGERFVQFCEFDKTYIQAISEPDGVFGVSNAFRPLSLMLYGHARRRIGRRNDDTYPSAVGTSYPSDESYQEAHRKLSPEKVRSEILRELQPSNGYVEKAIHSYNWYSSFPKFTEAYPHFARRNFGIVEVGLPSRNSMNILLYNNYMRSDAVSILPPSTNTESLWLNSRKSFIKALGYKGREDFYKDLGITVPPAFHPIPQLYTSDHLPDGLGLWIANFSIGARHKYSDEYPVPLIMALAIEDPNLAVALVDTVTCDLVNTYKLAEQHLKLSKSQDTW